ncbi:MAG TPA: hypothetical protein PKW56_02835 [Clostridiales bacterium]|nr:hypothetical protein [Clostridiales bacterium]
MSKRENIYNDKAGIIFLFVLIGTVFLADFFIEINKTVKFNNAESVLKYHYTSSDFQDGLSASGFKDERDLRYALHENVHNSTGTNAVCELSILFFLFFSFSFLSKNFRFDPNKLIISFLYFISFVFKEFSNLALPRPPPQL